MKAKNPSRTNPTICIWHSLSVVESNGQFASKFWRLKRCPIWTLRCKACRICSESGLFGRENLFPPTKKNLKMASLDWQKLPSSDWRPNSWGGGWCYVFSHWVQNQKWSWNHKTYFPLGLGCQMDLDFHPCNLVLVMTIQSRKIFFLMCVTWTKWEQWILGPFISYFLGALQFSLCFGLGEIQSQNPNI